MNAILCPYVRRAWYNIMPPGKSVNERVIFDYELVYIKEGKGLITIEEQEYTCSQGDVYLFRPKQRHSIGAVYGQQLSQPHIHFDLLYYPDRDQVPITFRSLDQILPEEMGLFRPDVLDLFFSPFPCVFRPRSTILFEKKLFDLIYTFSTTIQYVDITNISDAQIENARKETDLHLEMKLTQSFLLLWEQVLQELQYSKKALPTQADTAARLKLFIEQNAHRSISLHELAELVHFSRGYVSRIFTEAYSLPPLRYHAMMRIQRARLMIRYTNLSLTEISATLGFDSIQDFSRVFKKIDGAAPSHYQNADE